MQELLILLIVILVLAVLFVAFVWRMAIISQTPKRKAIDRKPDAPYEEVRWHSGDGTYTIKGWFLPAATAEPVLTPAPAIIIAHGWSSNRSTMLRYASRLHTAGYALLLYDARGHGESDGVKAASGITMRDDLRAALDYLSEQPGVDRKRIGVLGHSLGAFASVLSLGAGEHRIKALVTDSMPSRLSTMVAAELSRRKLPLFPFVHMIPLIWQIRTGIPRTQYDPVLAIDRTATPILMVHSRGDDFVPSTELDYVLKRIQRKVRHLYINSEGHSGSWRDEAFWEEVIPYFNKYLQETNHSGVSSSHAAEFEI